MSRRSILNRKNRRRGKKDFELQLTSMMDMLIILVVFLLKSYSTNAVTFATSPNIKLPTSTAEESPIDATNVLIEPSVITIDGEKIVDIKPGYELDGFQLKDGGRRILPLYDALVKTREKAELLMSKAVWKDQNGQLKEPPKFQGTLILHADKAVRYDFLRKVMYTAGAAQYKVFKLVTVKKDAG